MAHLGTTLMLLMLVCNALAGSLRHGFDLDSDPWGAQQSKDNDYQYHRHDNEGCSRHIKCGSGKRLNKRTCDCECANIPYPCPPNKKWDSQICQYVSDCQLTCRPGQVLNTDKCQCECANIPYQSPPNTKWDSQICQYVSNCQLTCRPDQVLNTDKCKCECANIPYPSPPNKKWDSQICQYVSDCQLICRPGQVLNTDKCQCECPSWLTCPPDQTLNSNTCQCECINNQFLPYKIKSPITGLCECSPITCPNGKRLDSITCQCECANIPYPSQPNKKWDSQICQYVSDCQLTCRPGQVLNTDKCQCECPSWLSCPPDQTLNSNTCQCECINNQFLPYKIKSPITGLCECSPITCPNGKRLDSITCQCVCGLSSSSCPTGQVFNSNSCQCECPPEITCPIGKQLNRSTCQCVCNKTTCSPNFIQNSLDCGCYCSPPSFCPMSAPFFNISSCQCETLPIVTCAPNQLRNPFTGQCEFGPLVVTCPLDQFMNPITSQCEPLPTPPTTPIISRTLNNTCQPSESRCQNGQQAYRDCKGRCVCACDERLYTGIYCEIRVEPQLCDNCTFQNGAYLAAVQGHPDMFVVCHPLNPQNTRFDARVQFCPTGTIFQRRGTTLRCFAFGEGTSPVDPCLTLGPGGRYGHSRECGRYFECSNSATAYLQCCPEGQGFNSTTKQCNPDVNCPNTCAGNFSSCTIDVRVGGATPCPYRARADNQQLFYHESAPAHNFTCGSLEIFNSSSCLCEKDLKQGCGPTLDFDFNTYSPNNSVRLQTTPGGNGNVGYFDGSARVILRRFANSGFYTPYLEISLRLKLNQTVTQEMAVATNADCGVGESLAITIDSANVNFKVVVEGTTQSQAQVLRVPYTRPTNGWLEISLRYEVQQGSLYKLTGTVSGNSQSTDVYGVIDTRECALQIGHGMGYSSLVGYVDDFKIWLCKK